MNDVTGEDAFEHGGRRSSKAAKRHARRMERSVKETNPRKPVEPRNEAQSDYMAALAEAAQVFSVGSAGTGKTYLAAHHAMSLLVLGKTDRIVVSRPTVSKPKHRMGFLPGSAREKIEPWLVPITSGFRDVVSAATLEKMTKEGKVEYLPFEHMRGRSISDAIIILDEAQNCDLSDLRLLLTRVGENSQVIVCGDMDQVDIPDSGLEVVLDMVEAHDISAEIIEFGPEDVVRSGIAKEWVKAFAAP